LDGGFLKQVPAKHSINYCIGNLVMVSLISPNAIVSIK